MIFRFDDVCINSDMDLHNRMTDYLFEKFPGCEVIWAVSPGVCHNVKDGRVYPKHLNAMSDFRKFYQLRQVRIPELRSDVIVATHGLFHADHRLLSKDAQEISIISSSSLLRECGRINYFVPPFNKYNKDTEDICEEHEIELVKWEDGWMSMEHNSFGLHCKKYYLHAREWTFETFKAWFEK